MALFTMYYYGIKIAFLFALVHSFVKFEPLQRHLIFIALLYTAAVAFLSWVFLMMPQQAPPWRAWQIWLGETFALSAFYFWLLRRFDAGFLFLVLLVLGFAVALF